MKGLGLILVKIRVEVLDETLASLAHTEHDFEERNNWEKPRLFHRQVFQP